jgi:hypothetical protein
MAEDAEGLGFSLYPRRNFVTSQKSKQVHQHMPGISGESINRDFRYREFRLFRIFPSFTSSGTGRKSSVLFVLH